MGKSKSIDEKRSGTVGLNSDFQAKQKLHTLCVIIHKRIYIYIYI